MVGLILFEATKVHGFIHPFHLRPKTLPLDTSGCNVEYECRKLPHHLALKFFTYKQVGHFPHQCPELPRQLHILQRHLAAV